MSDLIERPTSLQSFIERAALNESFDLDKFRELLLMQREAEQHRAKHEFNIAMSRVQSELQSITRDRSNPATRSKYATMQAIDAEARRRGVLSMIDGAHAPGMVPLQIDALGCDFYGANCHKWLLAPTGSGFLVLGRGAEDRRSLRAVFSVRAARSLSSAR